MIARPEQFAAVPHNLSAERSVLGSLLQEPELADGLDLAPEDFWLAKHTAIFRAILASRADTGATDVIATRNVLEREGKLGECGGDSYLLDLTDGVLTGRNVQEHARIVREKACLRRLRDTALAVVEGVGDGRELADIVGVALTELRAIADGAVKASPIADLWRALPPVLLSTQPPPRRWVFRHPDRDGVLVNDRHGDGLMPASKVELLVSAGGVGKTRAVIAAAVSVITGRRWFDYFDVDPDATGDVLLVLAEEDADECHRRLYDVAQALNLTEDERREVERRLVVLPFAGVNCAVASGSSDGTLRTTSFVDDLLRQMAERKWSLVVLDPLSRFAGVPIDVDNSNATFVMQQFERLAIATGAAVLVAHHSSKQDRQQGRATARGASGIEDAARWVATLVAHDEAVRFLQSKSNYSRPMRDQDAVVLVRERGGHLRVQTAAERAVQDGDTTAQDVETVVAALRRIGGRIRTASSLAKAAGGRKQDMLAAIEIAVAKGQILWEPKSAPERKREYLLPGDDRAHTHPRTPGNREPGFPGSADREPCPVPGTAGTEREPGTERGRGGPRREGAA